MISGPSSMALSLSEDLETQSHLSITMSRGTKSRKLEPAFKAQAYALILLRGAGHPCVFYGDLFPNQEYYNESVGRNIALLVEARRKFAYGPLEEYFHDRNCIGFVRKGDTKHPGCAVILSNKEEEQMLEQYSGVL
ncbi:hypothetical protein D9756_003471 [Leucocoprinus leucothites]|uniref:Uncharacterized protein n=1 Tax=Leucocoprinus leucothites TaxID=201217 RepID=A0A8H5G6X3_9AGAR|nr:hypothetical protein D9756_003471 [Leucoagaricus leucothites]